MAAAPPSYLEAVVLGVVQGLTEFLPISSTAHLRIVPPLFGWGDPGAAVSAVIQCGTLLAVFAALWPDIAGLAAGAVAGLRSGRPLEPVAAQPWAPLLRSYAGLPELPPAWVALHRSQLTVLDVRSAEEFHGPDGHISGSVLIPLPELERRRGEIPVDRPLVVVCHSGSRSALATQQLLKAGHSQVANLRGGLARWGDEGYPLEGVVA